MLRGGRRPIHNSDDEVWENFDETDQQEVPVWQEVSSAGQLPQRRHAHSAVVYSGRMYIFGGITDTSVYLNDLLEYNYGNERWSRGKTAGHPPIPRHSHSALVYQDSMYVFGGSTGDEIDNIIHEYIFANRTWKKVVVKGNLPPGRWGHSAVLHGTSMYIFGGYERGITNQFLRFDFAKAKWSTVRQTGTPPPPRQYHSAVRYKDFMYVFGGQDGHHFNDFYRFNFLTNGWESLPSPQQVAPRSSHVAVRVDNLMTVHGGHNDSGLLADFFAYDFDDGLWRPVKEDESTPTGRQNHTAIIWNNSLFIFGGLGLKSPEDATPQSLASFYQHDCSFEEDDSNPRKQQRRKSDLDSEMPGMNFLKVLPHELSIKILRYFDPRTLAGLCLVSKSWKKLSESDEVWLLLVHGLSQTALMKDLRVSEERMSWKTRYKSMIGTFRDFNARRLSEEETEKLEKVKHEVINLVVCGRVGCGKSALALRFSAHVWEHDYDTEITNDHHRLGCLVDNIPVMVEIDSSTLRAGDKLALSEYDEELQQGDGFLLIYSITDEKSLIEAELFHDRIMQVTGATKDGVPMILVGNKRELEGYRAVSPEQGQALAHRLGVPFLETSAKSGENVDRVFYDAVRQVMKAKNLYKPLHSGGASKEESHCILS